MNHSLLIHESWILRSTLVAFLGKNQYRPEPQTTSSASGKSELHTDKPFAQKTVFITLAERYDFFSMKKRSITSTAKNVTNQRLITFLVDMRLQWRSVTGSFLVIPLPSVRLASRNGNSFGSRFYSHRLLSRPFRAFSVCMFQAGVIS